MTRLFLLVATVLGVASPAHAQTLAEASAAAKLAAHDGCAVWSEAERRCLQATPPVAPSLGDASAAALAAGHTWTLSSNTGPAAAPDTFTPTKDTIFVCTARSIKALFTVVDAEHHGYFTQQFADAKLRENPALVAAAQADSASCKKGAYIGAMAQALKAEAAESARLQGLLRGIK